MSRFNHGVSECTREQRRIRAHVGRGRSGLALDVLMWACSISAILFGLRSTAVADEVVITTEEDLVAIIDSLEPDSLKPGDVATLAPGVFTSPPGGFRVTVAGLERAPIIIRGAGSLATVIDGAGGGAVLRVDGGSHLIFQNLVFTNAREGVDLDPTSPGYSYCGCRPI